MTTSQFLGDLFELVTLDHIAHLIFAEVAQLDSAFQTGSDFFDVVLETAKRRNPAIVNRLSSSQNASAPDAGNPAIGHEATSDDASAQLENLFYLGVSNDGFPQLRFKQTGHGVFDLIKQLINNAVKRYLDAFAFCSRHCHGLNFHAKTDNYRLGRAGEQNIGFRNRPDRRVNNFQIDFFGFDLFQRIHNSFHGTLRVGFQNHPQHLLASGGFEQTLECGALRHEKLIRPLRLKSLVAQLLGSALRFHHEECVASSLEACEPKDLYRCRRAGLLYGFAAVVEQRLYLSAVVAADKWIADFQRSHLHNYGGRRATAGFHLRFNDGAARSGGRRCFQFHYFGLKRHHLEQVIDSGALRCRDGTNNCFSSPILRSEPVLLQLFLHAIEVRAWKIHLVDSYHDLHMGRGLGVINRFSRLRHNAVVGRNHQHNDVSDVRATRSHGGECGVSRRVDKRDLVAVVIDAIRADVLRNSAGFASCDLRFSNRV